MSIQQAGILSASASGIQAVMSPWWVRRVAASVSVSISFSLLPTGQISCNYNEITSLGSEAWYVPLTGGVGAGYWVRVTKTAGNMGGAALSTWLQLNVGRTWTVSTSTGGVGEFDLEIASDALGTTIVGRMMGNVLEAESTFV